MNADWLRTLIAAPESRELEFKAASNRFSFDDLVRYCVALANDHGGRIVFGVTDKRPRNVTGTAVFPEPGETEKAVFDRISRRVLVEELHDEAGKRVVVVTVPHREPGSAWNDRGTYWMRAGEALVPMPDDRLREIHAETAPDFTALVCDASMDDLDSAAIDEFRARWSRRDGSGRVDGWSTEELLKNAELLRDGRMTHAALLLFGTRQGLTRFIPAAEIVFEYRATEAAGPAQDRAEFREGFLLYQDRLWERINQRNDRLSYQDGLFRAEVPTFDEFVIREAVLNAFCHRDYRRNESTFIRQFPRRLEVSSPGGLPPGVTTDNILDEQNPRNRRLAEALGRCGLIERAGQGMNLMFERAIRQSKPLPDLTGTAAHVVRLTLSGLVTNPAFLAFLERVGEETLARFDTGDLLVLDSLQQGHVAPLALANRLPRLVQLGVVESVGRGRGTRYLLSRRFSAAIGERGTYTRHRGLDREQNKELLLRHLRDAAADGSPMAELQQVLPALSREQLKSLMDELRREGRAKLTGSRRWARWFPV